MKTFDRKDVLTLATVEDAKKYINKYGYFADRYSYLEELVKDNLLAKLIYIDSDSTYCFRSLNAGEYGLFLPADKVKEIEEPKRWRPFKDRDEFKEVTGLKVGDTILFKEKNYAPCCSNEAFILSLANKPAGLMFIILGGLRTSNRILFDKYEYSKDNGETWLPFGVEE